VVLTTYQSRIVTRGDSNQHRQQPAPVDRPGRHHLPDRQLLELTVNKADASNQIAAIVPYSPSSLLVATVAGGWYMVDGGQSRTPSSER